MNKTDRLFAIILELQARGQIRAEDLAETFEVNKRTIYRLITEKKLIARKEGSRTLVDYQSVKKHYESLPLLSGAPIPNAPQMMTIARKRRARA